MFPIAGKYSSIKNPKTCNCPVKIAIPVNNKIIPPIRVIFKRCSLTAFEKIKNFSINIPDKINGIANPDEYDDSKKKLLLKFSSTSAKAKIDPSMGPMQGVHPKPKAAPTKSGKAILLLFFSVKIRRSLFINCKLIIPIS